MLFAFLNNSAILDHNFLTHRSMSNNRREFIKSSSYALAGLGLSSMVSLESLAEVKKKIGANGKINVGAIGINGMGWGDLTTLLKVPETQVIGLCDVDENVLNYRKYELA